MDILEPDVRRRLAPNPSALTHRGTCTYVLGTGEVAVLDPGPADPGHLRALLDHLEPGERVGAILVSHAHLDHSEGARAFADLTGAPIFAFGGPEAGRSARMQALAAEGLAGGGEGVDAGFRPDVVLLDGETLAMGDWSVTALHTPGHFCNHLSFAMGDRVFTGDVVMGWSTTLISPPDGDLEAYFASLDRLAGQGARIFYPGHGDPVCDPAARLAELAAHRLARTKQILSVLAAGPATLSALTAQVYVETPAALHPAAARNLFAHLVSLVFQGRIEAHPQLATTAIFEIA
ncbi:MBL fold metallo-hydrolase [Rhodobacter capsulatus]|uniref:MBL fold metallo-hydrolase n=1 Tax=Rhodobacter capsulatus TaxID=1061 RepID=UPI0040277FD6